MPQTFSDSLTLAVQAYFKQQKNGKYATPLVWWKAIGLLLSFFGLYFLVLFAEMPLAVRYVMVIVWGLNALLLIFNIGHDAVHGSFSRYAWVNQWLAYSFNLVGANAYSWKLKHNDAHHLYTNIEGKDHDIEVDPLLRVSPHSPYRWHFRWQHWYWPLIYAAFSLLIIFVVDVMIFLQEKQPQQRFAQPIKEWFILIFSKIFYLFYVFWIPIYVAGVEWQTVLIAFFSYHFVNGLMIGLVFQPSHYFMESTFYQDESEKQAWHLHQLSTTVDIAPQNPWLSQLLGSLNANVPHHLYPKVCHIHYPHLSEIIQEKAREYQLPYHRKSPQEAVKSHINWLHYLSKPST